MERNLIKKNAKPLCGVVLMSPQVQIEIARFMMKRRHEKFAEIDRKVDKMDEETLRKELKKALKENYMLKN